MGEKSVTVFQFFLTVRECRSLELFLFQRIGNDRLKIGYPGKYSGILGGGGNVGRSHARVKFVAYFDYLNFV